MTGAAHRTSSHFVVAVGDSFVAFRQRFNSLTRELHRARMWRTEIGARRWVAANSAGLKGLVVVGSVENGVFVAITEKSAAD